MWSLLLFLAFHEALLQDQWRLLDRDGQVAVVWGAPQLDAEARARLQSAWVWSGIQPPRRIEPDAMARRRPSRDAPTLTLRVVRRSLGAPAALEVAAAPLAMWREIPEDLLPRWRVPAGGRLAIPYSSEGRWRLRVVGQGEGTWWVDLPPGQTSALLAPGPAADVRVQVVGPDGKPPLPVDGAVLERRPRQGANRSWAVFRSEDGILVLPALPDAGEVTLTVMTPGYVSAFAEGLPSGLPDRLELARGAVLSGRVLAADGRPVAGAALSAESWASPNVMQLFHMGAKSRDDGRWELSGVPPGSIVLTARAPGFAPFGRQMDVPPGSTDVGTITLPKGLTVAVAAVDDQGSPVPGARIDGGLGVSAETDARGLATLEDVAGAAPLKLTAGAPGHLPGKAAVNPPLPGQVRVALRRSFRVLGRLLERDGAPASGGTIETEQSSCQIEDRLDELGRFDLDLPPGERVTIVLRSPRTRELRLALPAGEAGEVKDLGDLMPAPGLGIAGRVVRDADGTPVVGARIWLPRPGAAGPLFAWAKGDVLETATGEDGSFRLTGLAPGPALVRVDAAGFARAQLDLALDGGASLQDESSLDIGEVRLRGGADVRVVLTAVQDVSEPAVARADLRGEWLEPDLLTAPVRNGEAMLRHVPPGSVLVSVLAGRKLLCERRITVPEAAAQLDVECRGHGVTVAGLVRVGDEPAGPGRLLWSSGTPPPASRIDTVVSPGGLRQQTILGEGRPQVDVPVSADGTFVTEDLSPGSWQAAWVPEAGVVTGSQTVEIPEAERFEPVLSFPGQALTGQVMDEDGQPAEGARVRDLRTGALAFAGADGSFALAGLEGNEAALQAQLGDLSSSIHSIRLEEGRSPEPVLLTLGRKSASRLEVLVLDDSGAPVPGAFVFLEEQGKGARILTAAADGQASASFEPPLPPLLRAAATAGSRWVLGGWSSWEEARSGLTLQLSEPGELVVTSKELHTAPRVVSPGGWDLSWLLRMLGAPLLLTPEQPLHLGGLPAGAYTLVAEGKSVTVTVRPGTTTQASF